MTGWFGPSTQLYDELMTGWCGLSTRLHAGCSQMSARTLLQKAHHAAQQQLLRPLKVGSCPAGGLGFLRFE